MLVLMLHGVVEEGPAKFFSCKAFFKNKWHSILVRQDRLVIESYNTIPSSPIRATFFKPDSISIGNKRISSTIW